MAGASILSNYSSLIAKQDTGTLYDTVTSWDAPSDLTISTNNGTIQDVIYVSEDSSRTCRVCCPHYRPFTYNMYQGKDTRGTLVAEYKRNCKLPVLPCKCCCYQTLYVIDGKTKEEMGFVREEFFVFAPTFGVRNSSGQVLATVHYKMCCTGLIYDCCPQAVSCSSYLAECLSATCCVQLPFLIYPLNSNGRAHDSDGSITPIYPSQALAASQSHHHSFSISFPTASTTSPSDRILYLGTAWLINDIFFRPSLPRRCYNECCISRCCEKRWI